MAGEIKAVKKAIILSMPFKSGRSVETGFYYSYYSQLLPVAFFSFPLPLWLRLLDIVSRMQWLIPA